MPAYAMVQMADISLAPPPGTLAAATSVDHARAANARGSRR